jgi:hypothetical protein
MVVRTVHWYRFSTGTIIISIAVVRIGYICDVVTNLWRTYWCCGWNKFLFTRYRIGLREDTTKFAIRIGDPSTILLLFTVVKIYGAVVCECYPTCTLVKFTAVFWNRE